MITDYCKTYSFTFTCLSQVSQVINEYSLDSRKSLVEKRKFNKPISLGNGPGSSSPPNNNPNALNVAGDRAKLCAYDVKMSLCVGAGSDQNGGQKHSGGSGQGKGKGRHSGGDSKSANKDGED
jgi:hypothetical protein